MYDKLRRINEKLSDARSKKVVFLSHCILNENTRYAGGAFCSGINIPVFEEIKKMDCGIVQLSCPEQLAWGGVTKRLIWRPLGSTGKVSHLYFKLVFPVFLLYTHWRYSRLATEIVSQIKDYVNSGYEIVQLVGVDGSPTCGIHNRLNFQKCFRYISDQTITSLNVEQFNRELYQTSSEKGRGLFMRILIKKLSSAGVKINLNSIDILEQMKFHRCDQTSSVGK